MEQKDAEYPDRLPGGQPHPGRSQLHIQRVISRILQREKAGFSPPRLEEDDDKCCYGISRPSEDDDEAGSRE